METNQYMDMFLDESREHLQSLNDGLLSLENDPNEVSVVNEIFRNAHTLKGMSATMGFNKIAELTHEMEDVLDLIRNNQLKEMQEKVKEYIFDGFTLRALQMVEVKINERLVNPLSEYKWSPIE